MHNNVKISTVLIVLVIFMICLSSAMAGGPLSSPRIYLGSTNTYDRLQQVDLAYDGMTVYDSTYGCRRTNPSSGQNYMYFALNDNYIYNGNYAISHIAVTYMDLGTQPFQLQYDGINSTYQTVSINRTNTGGWKTITFDIGDSRFANRQQGAFDFRFSDCGVDPLRVGSVYLWCRKESAGNVTISGGQFLTNSTRFHLVGADYIAPWQSTWADWNQMWGSGYQSATAERDLGQMELAGVTCIRAFLPFADYICSTEGSLNSTVLSNVEDFLARAENHGVKVIFVVGSTPGWLTTRIANEYSGWIQYGDYWTSYLYRKELADFLVQLCNTINMDQYESFMAFDLENEAAFAYWNGNDQQFYDSLACPSGSSNATSRAWNRWVHAKYGGLTNAYAAWGYQGSADQSYWVDPEPLSHFLGSGTWDKKIDDYYAFVADVMTETTNYVKNRVQGEALGRAYFTIDLVSRGFNDNLTTDQGMIKLLTNDWRRCSRGCDFVMFNMYNGYSTDSNWWKNQLVYMTSVGMDKPVVIGEFGYPARSTETQNLEIQRRTWQEIMSLASTAKIDGCMGWMWIDTADTSLNDSVFGIRYINDTPKPSWSQFTQDKTNLMLQAEPVADCTVEVDVDSYVSPFEQYYSQGRTLIRSLFDQGKYPRMITKQKEYPTNDTIYHLPTQTGDPVVGSLGFGASRGAIITYDSIPDFMVAGFTYPAQIQAQNVGTTTWTEANSYRLGTSTSTFYEGRWVLGQGETIPTWWAKTFNMNLTAPSTAGTYTDTWKMLQEYVTWFGQGHPHSVKVIARPVNGARITSHTIPQSVNRSSVFNVSITVKNESSSTWTEAAYYRLGAFQDSDPFAGGRQFLAPTDSIAPGQTKTFTFQMVAPSTKGVYRTDWQMVRDGVAWFGQKIDIEVNVE
ncbi:MAG: NBR1-Ig-like domain-containing protein [Armatimonadota bacterium]